jgi:hypothetical protein
VIVAEPIGGSAGTCTLLSSEGDCFTGNPGGLYRQRSRGVIDGTRTHFIEGHILVPRLLRPRPQSACKELNLDRSLIGRLHDPRATGGKL